MATQSTEETTPLLAADVWTRRVYGEGRSEAPETIDVLQPATTPFPF